MKKMAVSGLAAILLAATGSVPGADSSRWDSASMSLVLDGDVEGGGPTLDLDGYRLDFAKSLGDRMFVRGVANVYSVRMPSGDLDASTYEIGIGARYPISAGVTPIDLWGSLQYERVSNGGLVGSGPGIDVGLRAQVASQLELGVALKVYGDLDFDGSFDGDFTGYEISAAYEVQRNISLLLSYADYELEFDSGASLDWNSVWSLGVRLHF